jgi:hypothetical protein
VRTSTALLSSGILEERFSVSEILKLCRSFSILEHVFLDDFRKDNLVSSVLWEGLNDSSNHVSSLKSPDGDEPGVVLVLEQIDPPLEPLLLLP